MIMIMINTPLKAVYKSNYLIQAKTFLSSSAATVNRRLVFSSLSLAVAEARAKLKRKIFDNSSLPGRVED